MSTPIFPFELYLILENPVHLQSQSAQSKLTFRKNRFQKCSILENSRNFSFPESRNREALGSRSKTFRLEGDPRESNRMYRIKTDRKKKHRTRAIPRPSHARETETGRISVTGLETGEEERGTIERGRAIQRRPEREATLSRRGRKRGKETVYQG